MKLNLTIFFLFVLSQWTLAQEDIADYYYHQQGSNAFHLGVGFPTAANVAATFVTQLTSGSANAKATPQFTLKHEYGLTERIGIGVQAGYYTAETENVSFDIGQVTGVIDQVCCLLNPDADCCNETTTTSQGSSTFKIRAISVGGRGTYHFQRLEKLDTYSVISLAYTFLKTTSDDDSLLSSLASDAPAFEYFAGLGGRYYFNQNFAVYGEFGSGALTPFHVNLGLTYRL